MLTNPDEVTFERWSKLSALMLGMEEDAKRDFLHASEIDDQAFEVAQRFHLANLSRGVSRGDDALANHHAENLRRRLAGELVPSLPVAAPLEIEPTAHPEVPRGGALPEPADAVSPPAPVLVPSYLREPPPKLVGSPALVSADVTVAPFASGGPALPFQSGSFAPPSPSPSSRAPSRATAEPVDPGGETLPITSAKDDTLPFAAAKELRLMRVEVFAELTVELRRRPEQRAEILAKFGVESEERFTQLAQLWAQKLAESPAQRDRFDALTKRGGER